MGRLSPGMVTGTSARLRVDDWESPSIWVRSTPPVRAPVEHFTLRTNDGPGQAATWILDVDGLAPSTTYWFEIDGDARSRPAMIRTPPASLAEGDLLLALLSCYFPSEEYEQNPDRVLRCLDLRGGGQLADSVPHLKIFCGDQVYADVPWSWRAERAPLLYEGLYRDAWSDGRLGPLRSRGANLLVPEDHEFWNSFPDQMFYLARSGQDWFEWATAAADAAWAEQAVWNFAGGFAGGAASRRAWGQATLAGVDLFVCDARTDRVSLDGTRCLLDAASLGAHAAGSDRPLMGRDQLQALTAWADSVARLGVLVLGQPLLASATSAWAFDATMADFEVDYAVLVTSLRRNIEERGVTFVVLTGDIHWGRLVYWSPPAPPPNRPDAKLVEFVASPIARVGGLKSLLSRAHDVGKPAATTIGDDDRRPLRRLLPGFVETRVFATGDNNFGLLRFQQTTGDDRRSAAFELWGLTTLSHAQNRWLDTGLPYCARDSLDL